MRIFRGFGVLLVLLVGCSAPAPEPGRGDGVILLADHRPGMASPAEMDDPPDFVLYGDGRAIARQERGAGVLKLVEYHLAPQRIRALFDEAADAGLFDDEAYSLDAQVSDAGSLVLMLRSTQREHLNKIVLPSPDDHGSRGDAAAFAESLQPSRWAAGDFTRPPAPYRPGRLAVTYDVTQAANGNDEPRAWPLSEAEPVRPRCVVLTGAAAAQTQELGETVPRATRWRHGGVTFHAWVRPLLPDEADCRAIERRYLR
jgi:hypothetical protein